MTESNLPRLARAALVATLIGLALLSAPGFRPADAQTDQSVVSSDGKRLAVTTPYLRLEFDLLRPSLDTLRIAPAGDRQYGAGLGQLAEEGLAAGRRLRSTVDDPDGAVASWLSTTDSTMVKLEGIDLDGLATTTWIVTVPHDRPTLRIDRLVALRGGRPLDSLGLALATPSAPAGVDPSSLARMVGTASFRPEVGPLADQVGGSIGLLAVDNPELSFSARSDQPDLLAGRQDESGVVLSFVHRLIGVRPGQQLTEGLNFRFGWNNDYMVARSDYAPDLEARLLAAGYYGNAVITPNLGPVLSASMRDYRGSVWSRDSDYALQGYGYVLNDLSVFRNTLQSFVDRIDNRGVAPEYILVDGRYGNRQSWDSMANVIQGLHTYVSRTGELELYRRNETTTKKAMAWIRALDTNDDGLPDRDIFPYGYTDTVENGPMHTYAIAKFYAATLALADLEEAAGRDARAWRGYARTMKNSFKRPLAQGGYWNPETGYPIAWKRASGVVYTDFETFGIFEAIRVGLLDDPDQLRSIGAWLDQNRSAFLNSNPYPERLMINGYDLGVRKSEVPLDKIWIMDCNAPWITGISVPARVRLGRVDDAREMFAVYASSANRPTPHAEFGAGLLGRYGAGETQDGGRLWDNWSWFSVLYGSHFGLKMTPQALEIAPAPLDSSTGRHLSGVVYQGARLELELFQGGYTLSLDAPTRLLLRPPAGYNLVEVNGDGDARPARTLLAQAGQVYVIQAYR